MSGYMSCDACRALAKANLDAAFKLFRRSPSLPAKLVLQRAMSAYERVDRLPAFGAGAETEAIATRLQANADAIAELTATRKANKE